MTNPTHYLVPHKPTEEMLDKANDLLDQYDPPAPFEAAWERMAAASPNAGKVTEDQIEAIAEMLQKNSGFAVNSPSTLARQVAELLGLSVEGEN